VESGKADSSDKVYLHSGYDEKVRIAEQIKKGKHRTLVGGKWDKLGQLQLDFLRGAGLRPHHNVLDIGCGCLRAGVKLIPFLEPNHYYGIDGEEKLLRVGYRKELPAAGLAGRLSRSNLCCSRLFRHARLPEGVIDFGIAASVMTHLPYNFLRVCLENTEKYFRERGRLYVTFFEIPEGAVFSQPLVHPKGTKTCGFSDPYHYYKRDMFAAAEGTHWRARYVGDWGHPRGQYMMEYERV
jgi:SAM-dependent methyltransferase